MFVPLHNWAGSIQSFIASLPSKAGIESIGSSSSGSENERKSPRISARSSPQGASYVLPEGDGFDTNLTQDPSSKLQKVCILFSIGQQWCLTRDKTSRPFFPCTTVKALLTPGGLI